MEFCGYSIPHPADPLVNVRVQTTGEAAAAASLSHAPRVLGSPGAAAGEISAAEALRQACYNLKAACAHMKEKFQAAMAAKQQEDAMQVDG